MCKVRDISRFLRATLPTIDKKTLTLTLNNGDLLIPSSHPSPDNPPTVRKRTYNILALLLFVLLLTTVPTACTSDVRTSATQQGYIDLSVSVVPEFITDGQQPVPIDADLVPEAGSLAVTLTDRTSGASHTWQTADDFITDNQSFMAGEYVITVSGRKDKGPLFSATRQLTVPAGGRASVQMAIQPAEAMLRVSRAARSQLYRLRSLTVYTPEQGYRRIAGADSLLYVAPGELLVYADVSDATRAMLLALPLSHTLTSAHLTELSITLDGDIITAAANGTNAKLSLADGLPDGAPAVTAAGFTPGVTMNVTEGLTLTQPVVMSVNSPTPLRRLRLTFASELIRQFSMPFNVIDLLDLTTEQAELLDNAGMQYTIAVDRQSARMDFSHLIEEMSSLSSTLSQFSLLAEDRNGVCAEPMVLTIRTKLMDITLSATGAATVGVDTATLTLSTGSNLTEESDFTVMADDGSGNYTVPCPITDMTRNGSDITLTVKVPSGLTDVPVTIYYLGQPRLTATIKRTDPDIVLKADPFATSVILRIESAPGTGYSAEEMARITKLAHFTVNGAPASVWTRDPENGAVVINGLNPDRNYTIRLSLADDRPDRTVTLRTEAAQQIPAADFNDWHEVFSYKGLPSGGRFSATSVPVINRQNFVDVVLNWPKRYWASLNALTFDRSSSNQNTWYMQLSTILEGINSNSPKAMRLTSVGYDHAGEAIADYVQQDGQQLPYSAVVPVVRQRAAGRLWLGEYRYKKDGESTVVSGVPFTSRPSALNGFYKYLPDITDGNDRATVDVALVHRNDDGSETVVASGHQELRTASDFAAFHLQLNYTLFDVRPTHLQLMFCSSNRADFDNGDADVPVTADPRNGVMCGSTLWISQLSFTY